MERKDEAIRVIRKRTRIVINDEKSKSGSNQCNNDHNSSLVCHPVTAVSLLLGRLNT